jgi:dihydroneopterin aldolase
MLRIEVNDIRLYAFHGCLPEEALIGGNYIVSVFVDADVMESVNSDELQSTIDYVLLNQIVEEEMAIRSKLIEHVAHRILKRIQESDRRIAKVGVKVRKLSPPINGDVGEVAVYLQA